MPVSPYKLDLNFSTLAGVVAAKGRAFSQHVAHDVALGILGQEEVNEAGPGNFRLRDGGVFGKGGAKLLSEGTGRHAQLLGIGERDIARKVAVGWVATALHLHGDRVCTPVILRAMTFNNLFECLADERGNGIFHTRIPTESACKTGIAIIASRIGQCQMRGTSDDIRGVDIDKPGEVSGLLQV